MGQRRTRRNDSSTGPRGLGTKRPRSNDAGFSLVEVLVAAVVLAVAITGISGSILSSMALNRVNRDTAIAQQAARQVLEQIHGVPFDDVFEMYNNQADMAGELGPNFAVPGLEVQVGDPDGFCGLVTLPAVDIGGGVEELRENFVDAALGMPRDLNGDGVVDAVNHANDPEMLLLPVRVSVQWRGVSGPRQIVLETMLSSR